MAVGFDALLRAVAMTSKTSCLIAASRLPCVEGGAFFAAQHSWKCSGFEHFTEGTCAENSDASSDQQIQVTQCGVCTVQIPMYKSHPRPWLLIDCKPLWDGLREESALHR